MNAFRSFLLGVSVSAVCWVSCQEEKSPVVSDFELGVGGADTVNLSSDSLVLDADSDALVLSLTPTVNSLPVYYAERSGIFRALNVKVKLRTYRSQFDCDTAFLGSTAIGGVSDLVRLHYYADAGNSLKAVSATDGTWHLMASRKLRLKRTVQLKNRMVSVARFSASDACSENVLKKVGLTYLDVFRPQVNDYYLRAAMLDNNQIDAAMLPEPFATAARLSGHPELGREQKDTLQLGCLIFKSRLLAVADSVALVKKIMQGYNRAVDEINQKGVEACRKILYEDYRLPARVADSLRLPVHRKAVMPSATDVEAARAFLIDKGKWQAEKSSSVLLDLRCLPQ